jgi:hypothetical protein
VRKWEFINGKITTTNIANGFSPSDYVFLIPSKNCKPSWRAKFFILCEKGNAKKG